MTTAHEGVPYKAIYKAPGQTGPTIDLIIQKVVAGAYVDIGDSPLSLSKLRDGEYDFDYTFTELGVYAVRFGNVVSGLNVEQDRVGAIMLRTDSLPMG